MHWRWGGGGGEVGKWEWGWSLKKGLETLCFQTLALCLTPPHSLHPSNLTGLPPFQNDLPGDVEKVDLGCTRSWRYGLTC